MTIKHQGRTKFPSTHNNSVPLSLKNEIPVNLFLSVTLNESEVSHNRTRFFTLFRMTLTGEFMRGPHRLKIVYDTPANATVGRQPMTITRNKVVAGAQRCEK